MSLVLVTGASGFAGARICSALSAAGHEVVAIVRSKSPVSCLDNSNYRVIQADLYERLELDVQPEFVVHAAANANPNSPAKLHIRDTAMATANVARFAASKKVNAFIYLSSLSVYGSVSVPVVDENTPRHNLDPYGMSKYLGECVLSELSTEMPSISIRLPGLVGSGARGAWLSRLVAAALIGEKLSISNSEALFNNVIHVDGLAEFIIHLINCGQWEGAFATPIGADKPISIQQLAELVASGAGTGSKIHDAGQYGNPFIISSKCALQMGYRPHSVKDIVQQYIKEEKFGVSHNS